MHIDMAGKVALVTGASREIGAAIARESHTAAPAWRSRPETLAPWKPAERARRPRSRARGASGYQRPGGRFRPGGRVVTVYGRLDNFAVDNAAGGGHGPTPLGEIPLEAFDSGMAVTLRGVFLSMREEIPEMVRSGGGAMVGGPVDGRTAGRRRPCNLCRRQARRRGAHQGRSARLRRARACA